MTPFAERIDIVRRLDVDAALRVSRYTPPGGFKDNGEHAETRETVLAGLHKARIMGGKNFTKGEALESRLWLTVNGWKAPK